MTRCQCSHCSRPIVYVCRFDAADHVTGKRRTYATVKAAVLEAGRFSTFEATSSMKNARLFTKLCRDPEIETFELGFPWTGVRLRVEQGEL